MNSDVDAAVVRIARRVARDVMNAGARAVVLTGSYVRGDAHAHSDIDLVAMVPSRLEDDQQGGALRPYRMRGGRLVALACETQASVQRGFRDPRRATTFVPGWRSAFVLSDQEGIAARVIVSSKRWTWDVIGDKACDRYVAQSITGLAEEAHKLAGLLSRADAHAAAAQRSILAVWLAGMLAVHHRILFGTDNELWRSVDERMGAEWRRTQAAALSEGGETLRVSCVAALRLYALAAAEVRGTLSREQREVVDAAARLGQSAARRRSRISR